MMRKRILAVILTVVCCVSVMTGVAASNSFPVVVNGQAVNFAKAPVMIDDRMLVPIRGVAEAMNCKVDWNADIQAVLISNKIATLTLRIDHVDMKVVKDKEESTILMDVPPILIEDTTYLPLRTVVEQLGGNVLWKNGTTYVDYQEEEEITVTYPESVHNPDGHTFYFQNEERFQFPNRGEGYCWVCSYAMVLSDVMGYPITPVDVAAVNLEYSSSGAYCYHYQIVSKFGAKFVPAVDTASPYYKGFDQYFGATYLELPDEKTAVNALKEALTRNPAGILVRFEAVSPHTLVAIGFEGDTIYFNETIPYGGEYSTTSIYRNIPFNQTFPGGYCGLGLKDLTSIQAIVPQ